MDVTPSMLIYWIVTLVAVLLCIWTAGSAVPRVREHDGLHRLVTLVGAALLLPIFAVATLAVPLGHPEFGYGAILLPTVVVCTTWSNLMTLRDQRWLIKILHVPTLFFNATLVGLYSVRVIQDFLGEDLGTWGSALTIAHVTLQTQVGSATAATNPIWFHLPFLLPLCLRFRWYHVMTLTISGTISAVMVAMLFVAMPMAYTRADSYRDPRPMDSRLAHGEQVSPTQQASREARPVGVKAPWGLGLLPASTLWHVRQALMELRTPTVAVDVSADTFADDRLNDQLAQELAWARERGMSVTVICKLSASLQMLPSATVGDLRQKLAETQWLAAENLRPSLLVLFSGPFGRLTAATNESPTIDEWMTVIAQSAREARQANPKIKVGVAIESLGPHAAELFRRLRAEESPVDVVGINIFQRQRLIPDLDKDLSRLRRWIERSAGGRRVEILETGCTPHEAGGELGQWHFLVRVLAMANRVEGIEAVCIDALSDPGTSRGLVTGAGRRRLAFRLLNDSANDARPGK